MQANAFDKNSHNFFQMKVQSATPYPANTFEMFRKTYK